MRSACFLSLIFLLFLPICLSRTASTSSDRNLYIRRWREGLKRLHLLERSKWPKIILSHSKNEKTKKVKSPQNLSSTISLPPMEVDAVNDLNHQKMPTFDEFQAMLSDSKLQRQKTADAQPTKPSFINGKPENGDQPPVVAIASLVNASSHHDADSIVVGSLKENEKTTTEIVVEKEPVEMASESAGQDEHLILPLSDQGSETGLPISHEKEIVDPTTMRVLRNIAAVECGAKLLKASPGAKNPASVLVNNNDEYLNQPCSAEKWFILETCEPVQLGTIQIANFELFSSRCKTFRVSVSDRYPTKQWEILGTFQAHDTKGMQSFNLPDQGIDRLIKYVKFEMLDHYGNEHFCPITMVRLFGLVSDDLDDADIEAETTHQSGLLDKSANETTTPISDVSEEMVETQVEDTSSTDENKQVLIDDRCPGSDFPNSPIPSDNVHTLSDDRNRRMKGSEPNSDPAETNPPSQMPSPGILIKATRFILRILKGAGDSPTSDVAEFLSTIDKEKPLTLASISKIRCRSDDLYTVLYLLISFGYNTTSSNHIAHSPTLYHHHHHALHHLAECLFSFCQQLLRLPPDTPLPFSIGGPHAIWPACSTSANLLNLTQNFMVLNLSDNSSPLSLIRLVAAYLNISRTLPSSNLPSLFNGNSYLLPGNFAKLPSFLIKKESTQKQSGKASFEKRKKPSEDQLPPQINLPIISSSVLEDFVVPASLGGSRKETAYMRLSNRVRQIEANVTISMRYLQELSQSYTKQTERLSNSFNLTIAWMKAIAKTAEDRDFQQQLQINALEKRLSQLLTFMEESGLIELIRRPTSPGNSSYPPEFKKRLPEGLSDAESVTTRLSTFLWSSLFPGLPLQSPSGNLLHRSSVVDRFESARHNQSTLDTCPSNASLLLTLRPMCSASSLPDQISSEHQSLSFEMSDILIRVLLKQVILQASLFSQTRVFEVLLKLFGHLVLAMVAHAFIYLFFLRRLIAVVRKSKPFIGSKGVEDSSSMGPPILVKAISTQTHSPNKIDVKPEISLTESCLSEPSYFLTSVHHPVFESKAALSCSLNVKQPLSPNHTPENLLTAPVCEDISSKKLVYKSESPSPQPQFRRKKKRGKAVQ